MVIHRTGHIQDWSYTGHVIYKTTDEDDGDDDDGDHDADGKNWQNTMMRMMTTTPTTMKVDDGDG